MKTERIENKLISALQTAQSSAIGVFKPNGAKKWELVIDDNMVLTTISIGEFFGLSTSYIPSSSGKYVKFPDGKTLINMMDDPFEFHEFCKINDID